MLWKETWSMCKWSCWRMPSVDSNLHTALPCCAGSHSELCVQVFRNYQTFPECFCRTEGNSRPFSSPPFPLYWQWWELHSFCVLLATWEIERSWSCISLVTGDIEFDGWGHLQSVASYLVKILTTFKNSGCLCFFNLLNFFRLIFFIYISISCM